MLYVNRQLIDTRNKNAQNVHHEIILDYDKTIKQALDYYGNYLIVETKIRPRVDKSGAFRPPSSRGLLLIANVNRTNLDGSNSMEELRYSPTILKEEDGNLIHESPSILIQRGSYSIDIKKNQDLAYYILRSGKVGLTPAEGKKFHIHDIKVTNEKAASKRRAEGAVLNLIYSSLPEENLRILAKSWGIDGVDGMDAESVREMLFDKVESGEAQKRSNPNSKARGFKEFAASSEVKAVDKLTALCKDAETAGKLKYDTGDRIWTIDYKDGGMPYALKELSGDEFGDPLGALVSYLFINKDALRKVHNVLGMKSVPKIEEKDAEGPVIPRMDAPLYTVEQVEQVGNHMKLKKMLREVDPNYELPSTIKAVEVKRILLQKLAEISLQETQG